MTEAFDLTGSLDRPHAFLQWKGTDVCLDFHCSCELHLHFDGYFAYRLRCLCGLVWEMPFNLFPRQVVDDPDRPAIALELDSDVD